MKCYTLRPDTFTLNFHFTLSGTVGELAQNVISLFKQHDESMVNQVVRQFETGGGGLEIAESKKAFDEDWDKLFLG